jgi:hypothetical protein
MAAFSRQWGLQLWDIAATNTQAAVMAKSVLTLVADTLFEELLEEVILPQQQRIGKFEEDTAETTTKENIQDELKIHVYPNPASSEIIISFSKQPETKIQIEIYDITGKLVSQSVLIEKLNEFRIGTEYLAEGTYTYRINNDVKTISKYGKFMILR